MDAQIFHSPKAGRCKYCGAEILWVKSKNETYYAVHAYWQPSLKWYAGSRTDFHKCGSIEARQKHKPDTPRKFVRDRKRHTL